jgi:hypothetical protein
MASKTFEGQTLPFTQHGWTRQIKSGYFRNGATYKQVEKVKVLGRGTMGAKLEDVHILASWDIDQGGNKTINTRKGQHYISLKKGATELAFAVHGRRKDAEEILVATNWRKWADKNKKKGEE